MPIFKKKSSWRFLGKSSKLWVLHKVIWKKRLQHRSMKLHPCPAQNSVFQASHCSALLIGYVKYCFSIMLGIWSCNRADAEILNNIEINLGSACLWIAASITINNATIEFCWLKTFFLNMRTAVAFLCILRELEV